MVGLFDSLTNFVDSLLIVSYFLVPLSPVTLCLLLHSVIIYLREVQRYTSFIMVEIQYILVSEIVCLHREKFSFKFCYSSSLVGVLK